MNGSKKLHTVDEIAELFNVHPVTVRKKVAALEWPCLLLGTRTLRFTDDHIQQILHSSERPARSA